MPTCGNLKFGDSLFCIIPPPPQKKRTTNPPDPDPPPAPQFDPVPNLSHANGLGHYMKSYMSYRPSQFGFMIVMAK